MAVKTTKQVIEEIQERADLDDIILGLLRSYTDRHERIRKEYMRCLDNGYIPEELL